ncbi:MAG: MFS transporter [Clostridiales Family XIII bacterium]|jgi:OFA family oxalate/formate antiporter-like MFS transporter|nr:MFS transporter [Clostridiales Family XIII bacterium]
MQQSGKHKRSITAVVGAIMLMLVGLIYAWSVFKNPLSDVYPMWSESELSLVFTISMICWCVGGLISGMLLRKIKNGLVVLIAAALMFTGFLALSFMPSQEPAKSLLIMYIFYSVFCGLGVGLVYNSALTAAVRSFPEKAGTVSGILLMAYGFGGMIFGSIVNRIIAGSGLQRTFFLLAVSVAAILAVGQFFLKPVTDHRSHDTEGKRIQTATPASPGIANDFMPSEMTRKFSYWIYFVNIIVIASGGLLVINNAVPIAQNFGAGAALGLTVTVSNGIGRVFFGWLFDMRGRRPAMSLDCSIMILAGAVFIFGSLHNASVWIIIGFVLTGLSYGGSASLSASIVNLFFGAKNYAANLSIMNCSIIIAAIIGPMVSSKLYENAGNSWFPVFVMLLILGVCGLVTFLLLNVAAKFEKFE